MIIRESETSKNLEMSNMKRLAIPLPLGKGKGEGIMSLTLLPLPLGEGDLALRIALCHRTSQNFQP
jgi:hypothetical protein